MKKRDYRGPLTFRGETKTQREWAEQYGMPHSRLNHRLRHGWSVHKALTTPRDTRGRPGKGE